MSDVRGSRGLTPLLLLSAVVVLLAFGLARGTWLPNLHNGLLALAFVCVGAYIVRQRPGHRAGRLFLATGAVEAVLFFGRQVGHFPGSAGADRWWGWLGVWPISVALALTTLSVIHFPDGRLPSPRWRWVVVLVCVLGGACAGLSAMWPVEYPSTGVGTEHPIHSHAPEWLDSVWSATAHPIYIAFQALWLVALLARWRDSDGHVRRQVGWLVAAAAVSVVALLGGLLVSGSPRAGLLTAALLPVVAGWAIVHGQQVAAYSALSWLSRGDAEPEGAGRDLPAELARAVAGALSAPRAVLWMGTGPDLHAVGVWPETGEDVEPVTLDTLLTATEVHARPVGTATGSVGALSVDRPRSEPLSLAESRLFDDLLAQAGLVLGHLGLAEVIARERRAGHLEELTPREHEVLELMARALSNAAICAELHLSIKTVEPAVGAIFAKLGLHADPGSNRRVLAVLAFVRD